MPRPPVEALGWVALSRQGTPRMYPWETRRVALRSLTDPGGVE